MSNLANDIIDIIELEIPACEMSFALLLSVYEEHFWATPMVIVHFQLIQLLMLTRSSIGISISSCYSSTNLTIIQSQSVIVIVLLFIAATSLTHTLLLLFLAQFRFLSLSHTQSLIRILLFRVPFERGNRLLLVEHELS